MVMSHYRRTLHYTGESSGGLGAPNFSQQPVLFYIGGATNQTIFPNREQGEG